MSQVIYRLDCFRKYSYTDIPIFGTNNLRQLSRHFQGTINIIHKPYSAETSEEIELSLRTLLYFLQAIDDEKSVKLFHQFVPKILPNLFSAFTNDELVNAHGREQILDVLYYCLRTVSWADGIDNDLVEACLSETFNSWMSLFLQVI